MGTAENEGNESKERIKRLVKGEKKGNKEYEEEEKDEVNAGTRFWEMLVTSQGKEKEERKQT